ncbi:hypothetical protein D3C87_1621760 [compost metagenome]
MPHHTQRLLEVIGHGVAVHFADPALLGANTGGKIAEMVNRQRNVGCCGFTDRFAVVPGFCRSQQLQILLHPVGNFEQNSGAILNGGVRPFLFRFMRCIQRQIDVFLTGAGDFAQRLPGHGRQV